MKIYIGVDVQIKRPCSYAVVDQDGAMLDSGWFDEPQAFAAQMAFRYGNEKVQTGIDACRHFITKPRGWYWNGSKKAWRAKTPGERGWGRHCEVVIKAMGLGNPQWTPFEAEASEWMVKGKAIFDAMESLGTTHEVFPTACYRLLHQVGGSLPMTLDFGSFAPGPKDMLDACVAAATVRMFALGQGCEVGGGDGLGTIVLPAPLEVPEILSRYPGA